MSDERQDALDALARSHGTDPDELRREVSRFRLQLDADLTVAAAAVDDGAPAVAADVLAAEARALPRFEQQLRGRVADLLRPRRGASRRRVVAVAATTGLVGVIGGAALAATAVGHSERATSVTAPASADLSPARTLAASQADTLTYAADHQLPTPTILAASGALRTTLLPLMAQAPRDGALASQLRSLLAAQRLALSSVPSPDAEVDAAIRSTQSLLTQLAAGTSIATALSPGPAATPSRRASASVPSTIGPSGVANPHTQPLGTATSVAPVSSAGLPGPG